VFVIPGNIGVAACAGSNALLRDGATAVCCGWDVLQEYELRYPGMVCKPETEEIAEEKVAQKPVIPENSSPQGSKKSIDNPAATSYSKSSETDLPPDQKAIFDHLGTTPILVDELIAETGIPTAKVLTALTMLTMRGLIVNHPGRRVSRKRNSMSGGNEA
jgi:DNA processing protein